MALHVRRSFASVACGVVLAAGCHGSAVGGPLEDGLAAVKHNDYASAMRLLRPLADQGDAIAQLNVGMLFAFGLGVARDKAEGIAWYRKAADQGNAEAEARLGDRYEAGNGVKQDFETALFWLRKSAAKSNALGETSLGLMYLAGQGAPKDYMLAAEWLTKGAAQGNADALCALGMMNERAMGRSRSYVLAYAWYDLAISRAPPEIAGWINGPTNLRNRVAANMTRAQIAEAKRVEATLMPNGGPRTARPSR